MIFLLKNVIIFFMFLPLWRLSNFLKVEESKQRQVYGTCHNNYHDTYNYHAIQLGEIFTKKKKKAKENQKKKKKKFKKYPKRSLLV